MSRELIFYPGIKDAKTGKYKALLTDMEGNPASIFWRSGSFIDLDYFIYDIPMISRNEFDESCKDYFTGSYDELYSSFNENGDLNDAPTYVYELSEDTLFRVGASEGLVSGYALLEDMHTFYNCDSPQEYYYWEMEKPIPAELYAELPLEEQKKYGRFATIDRYSKEYVCSILCEVLDDIYVPYEVKGEKCILVVFSF